MDLERMTLRLSRLCHRNWFDADSKYHTAADCFLVSYLRRDGDTSTPKLEILAANHAALPPGPCIFMGHRGLTLLGWPCP